MNYWLKRVSVFLCLCLTACSPGPQVQDFHAFGTIVRVEIDRVSPAQAQILFAALETQLQDMHHRWHAWQDSELMDIRQACQDRKPLRVSEDLIYLIQAGQKFEAQSQGAFNPAIGELIEAWGFLSQTSTQTRQAPTPERISKLLSYHPSMQDLTIHGDQLTCHNPHLRLDFGAYAKGYGVEKMMDYLQAQGVTRALINAGGDVMILQGPDDPPRRIAVQDPDSVHPLTVLSIKETTSVFTSGTYARNFKDSKSARIYHHLINPKTGYPSTDFVSVTVIDPDPVKADAAATALLASDKESWLSIIEGMDIKKYLLITKEGETISNLPL